MHIDNDLERENKKLKEALKRILHVHFDGCIADNENPCDSYSTGHEVCRDIAKEVLKELEESE